MRMRTSGTPFWAASPSSLHRQAKRSSEPPRRSAVRWCPWFPQALLYGFWQSHLGRKRSNSKHARAWVSEIIGWQPAATDTRVLGLKGDPLNLTTKDHDVDVIVDEKDPAQWDVGAKVEKGFKKSKLSEIGHGQVPFMGSDAAASAVSFQRVTQRATVSFAQLRRVSLGQDASREADAATRALVVALGLHAHQLAFGHAFALRSGADLRPTATTVTWLGSSRDETCEIGGADVTRALLDASRTHAELVGVPLEGWGQPPKMLQPGDNLAEAIRLTWPALGD